MDTCVPEFVLSHIFPVLPELTGLPQSRAADIMLLAIGFQESGFVARHQVRGSAVGFWQLDAGGVDALLQNQATRVKVDEALNTLGYKVGSYYRSTHLFDALEHNDFASAALARILLWANPARLPESRDLVDVAWNIYVNTWRPGKPRRNDWAISWNAAWDLYAKTR
jgi:hypothetical protein